MHNPSNMQIEGASKAMRFFDSVRWRHVAPSWLRYSRCGGCGFLGYGCGYGELTLAARLGI